VIVARWTYDFGASRFVQTVTLENGKVVAVERGGYGSALALPRPARASVVRCDPQRSFHVGDTMYDVLSRCGEPVLRDFKRVERQLAVAVSTGSSTANRRRRRRDMDVQFRTATFSAV
jgi:hypothetical protein